jgi:pilus assembly protein CpaB
MFLRNALLAIGAVFVIAGTCLFVLWFGDVRNRQAMAERPAGNQTASLPASRAEVLAAAHAIPGGTLLRAADFQWKQAGPDEVRPGNLLRGQVAETEFLGALSRRYFQEGEALIASEFVKPSERQFLAAVLTPGCRAVSVSVDAAQIGAGLLLPGDRVDVILTQTIGSDVNGSPRNTAGETVIRDARVIAIDQSLDPQPAPLRALNTLGGAPHVPKTVTLELTERQAEALLVAEQLGKIALSVRPLEGSGKAWPEEKTEAGPVWASDVSIAFREAAMVRPLGGAPGAASPQTCDPKASVTGSTLECSVRRPPSSAFGNAPFAVVTAGSDNAADGPGRNQRDPSGGQERGFSIGGRRGAQ